MNLITQRFSRLSTGRPPPVIGTRDRSGKVENPYLFFELPLASSKGFIRLNRNYALLQELNNIERARVSQRDNHSYITFNAKTLCNALWTTKRYQFKSFKPIALKPSVHAGQSIPRTRHSSLTLLMSPRQYGKNPFGANIVDGSIIFCFLWCSK